MATACNKEIEVKYDYNVNDYVQLAFPLVEILDFTLVHNDINNNGRTNDRGDGV